MHARPLSSNGFRLDPDFHVVSERIKQAEETVRGETAQMASDKGRHFGLINVENLGGLGLREAAALDDAGDLPGQLCLGKRLVGIPHPDVGEDVPFTFLNVAVAHDDRPLSSSRKLAWCSLASLRRARMS